MHKLQNGSQVSVRPQRKPLVGLGGYFSESNDQGAPSYPGQDWFNDCTDEFINALDEMGITYDQERLDHLARAFAAVRSQEWNANVNYGIGQEVVRNGLRYIARAASGPDNGGAVTPGGSDWSIWEPVEINIGWGSKEAVSVIDSDSNPITWIPAALMGVARFISTTIGSHPTTGQVIVTRYQKADDITSTNLLLMGTNGNIYKRRYTVSGWTSAWVELAGPAFTTISDRTASRQPNITYQNGNKARQVCIALNAAGPGTRVLTIIPPGGSPILMSRDLPNAATSSLSFDVVIPPGATYSFNGSFSQWIEVE